VIYSKLYLDFCFKKTGACNLFFFALAGTTNILIWACWRIILLRACWRIILLRKQCLLLKLLKFRLWNILLSCRGTFLAGIFHKSHRRCWHFPCFLEYTKHRPAVKSFVSMIDVKSTLVSPFHIILLISWTITEIYPEHARNLLESD